METIRSQLAQHMRNTCPDAPDALVETTSDIATHIYEQVKDTVIRIARTAPEPRLTGLMAIQLIKMWIEAELAAQKEESATR